LHDKIKMDKKIIEQYSRHILLPEIGLKKQEELQKKSVLIIGLGGLGCIQAIYLTTAGVGKIGLLDGDVVERTNLQRQILYSEKDLGKSKVVAAKKYLKNLNSNIEIKSFDEFLNTENVFRLFTEFDIIIDSTDNFSAHYLINDACVLMNKDHSFGSIFRFEGQVSFFDKKNGPCYRCLYPNPPQPGTVLNCEAGGVLNHLPGVIGLLQSIDALKYLLGIRPSLVGQLLVFESLTMDFQKFGFEKNSNCSVCGENAKITNFDNYELTCGIREIALESGDEISVSQLRERFIKNDSFVLVDVRESEEFELTKLPRALLIPFNRLHDRMHEINVEREIIVYCRSGVRSARATLLLKENGYKKVKNLRGGIKEYAEKIDPSIILY